jgi:tRNA G37 N-methylase Trm5
MRHLRVPKQKTQSILDCVNSFEWSSKGYRVLDDGEFKLVPLGDNPPDILSKQLNGFEEKEAEQSERLPQKWIGYLPQFIDEKIISLHEGGWPNAQEPLGDILLFKIEKHLEQYAQEVALAKITHHKKVRAVFRDHGVKGDFRIRELEPLAARLDGQILTVDEINLLSEPAREKLLQTETIVREYNLYIKINPRKAFFSHRLQSQRVHTVESAIKLREMLGRPLDVADPYCGVGPAFTHLLQIDELVGNLLACDINPDAMPLLVDNLTQNGIEVSLDEINEKRFQKSGNYIGVRDALTLTKDSELVGKYDVLLVNLPHETVTHLPHLIGLLKVGSPTLVRGWLIASEEEIPNLTKELQKILPHPLDGSPIVEVERRTQYNTTDWLCRFESWQFISFE